MCAQPYESTGSAQIPRIVGRDWELDIFTMFLSRQAYMERMIYITGPLGSGKTSLIHEFQRRAARQGIATIVLDATQCNPTAFDLSRQILHQLGLSATLPPSSNPNFVVRSALEGINRWAEFGPSILFIDGYERLEPLDDWLQEFFFAQISRKCLHILASRNPLPSSWTNADYWKHSIYRMPLGNLDRRSVAAYLQAMGISDPEQIAQIWRQTEGHPLRLFSLYQEESREEAAATDVWEDALAALPDMPPFGETARPTPKEVIYARMDLTHREKEVATLAAEGLTNRDIASRLFLSEVTIKKHMRSILQKVGASNRTQLLKLFMD